jgi:hypothetical protein
MAHRWIGLLVLGLTLLGSRVRADDLPTSNEIEEKLGQTTERMGGMLAIREVKDAHWIVVTALPLPTTFRMDCGSLGLTAYLGVATDDVGAVAIPLTDKILTEAQCVTLIQRTEGPLRRLTAAPQDVARSAASAP